LASYRGRLQWAHSAKSAAGKAHYACNAQGAQFVFDDKKEVVPFSRLLAGVAERSYELMVKSLSRNGEIKNGNSHENNRTIKEV
jgi:hypothetical protein